jgi:hypothetical protein
MNANISIYIPRISNVWTEIAVKNFMEREFSATVIDIDFIPINKKPGFKEDIESKFISAFVHFIVPDCYLDNRYLSGGIWTKILNGEAHNLRVSKDEYWICLKNKNPVKRTRMNIHQVVENGRHLENLIMEQTEDIEILKQHTHSLENNCSRKIMNNSRYMEELIALKSYEIRMLKETVEELTKKLDGINDVVYQLVGGLFCHEKQNGMMGIHLSNLGFDEFKNATRQYDTHPSGIWPTTRQGDENRERIEKLEETMKTMLEFDTNCFNYEQLDTKSECSSMTSNSSEERIKNSYDLCGNA